MGGGPRRGQLRINEFFRLVTERLIGRGVIATLVQQDDYMKREDAALIVGEWFRRCREERGANAASAALAAILIATLSGWVSPLARSGVDMSAAGLSIIGLPDGCSSIRFGSVDSAEPRSATLTRS